MMLEKRRHVAIAVLGGIFPAVLFLLWLGLTYVVYLKCNISNDDIEKFLSNGFYPVLYLSNGIGVLVPGYLTARRSRASLPASFYVKTVFTVWLVLSLLWIILENTSRHVEVNGVTLSLVIAFNFILCSFIGFYSGIQAEKFSIASDDEAT